MSDVVTTNAQTNEIVIVQCKLRMLLQFLYVMYLIRPCYLLFFLRQPFSFCHSLLDSCPAVLALKAIPLYYLYSFGLPCLTVIKLLCFCICHYSKIKRTGPFANPLCLHYITHQTDKTDNFIYFLSETAADICHVAFARSRL